MNHTPSPSTPPHTVGPFFHDALGWARSDAAAPPVDQDGVLIEGSVEDGADEKIPVWLIEAWVPQAVPAETAAGCAAPGFRRLMNNAQGTFSLHVPRPAAGQPAAFITVFGIGLSRHHGTAVFLSAEPVDGGGPSMLDAVPAERRATLVAERVAAARYRWTIRTQGERETVFFDYR